MKGVTQSQSGGAILAFGTVLLNTLPVWLAEFASLGGLSDEAAGALASMVLLASALACFQGAALSAGSVLRLCAVAVVVCFGVTAVVSTLPGWAAFTLALIIGVSLGFMLTRSLALLAEVPDPASGIGITISIGLVISLAILVTAAGLGLRILPIIAGTAVIAVAVAGPILGGRAKHRVRLSIRLWHLLPFFVAMGAFWVFLELYAQTLGIASVVGWIAASLVASAAGSALVGRIADERRGAVQSMTLILAAVTAGLTYFVESETLIGLMILANAFFLFLYIPLYLAAPTSEDPADAMTMRMALYLLGFAFGGIAGTALISLGGYGLMAMAIGATGLAAFIRD